MQGDDLGSERPSMQDGNIKISGYNHLGVDTKMLEPLTDIHQACPPHHHHHHQQHQHQQSSSRSPSPGSRSNSPLQHPTPTTTTKQSPPPPSTQSPPSRSGVPAIGSPAPIQQQPQPQHHHHQQQQPTQQHAMKPNQVRSVMLNGVPIVALIIDAKERLCLAQISNTLLKEFSYNEIHNRRVALGITCVQCTPVQLEILRRAGAMPISSRRCGMITKREAERLCKSFLTENNPPKLPENFSFDVVHECAWGSRGSFLPSRYNSSRAKCIKCYYCNMFFSPNKFIFHSHRVPESKYVQPDAANFNSWRRHLKLYGGPPNEIAYAWEDVKAMFNGGSRKRVMAASYTRFTNMKRLRQAEAMNNMMHAGGGANMPHGDKGVAPQPYGPPPYGGASKSFGHPGMTPAAAPVAYLAPRGGGGVPPPSVASCSNFVTAMHHVAPPGISMDAKSLVAPNASQQHPLVDYVWGKSGPAPCAGLPPAAAAAYGFIWARQHQHQQQQQVHHHHHHLHPHPQLPMTACAPDPLKLSPESFYDDRNVSTSLRGVPGGGDDSSDSSRGNCDSEVDQPPGTTRRSMSSCSEAEFRSSDNDELVVGGFQPAGGRVRSKDSGFYGSSHHHNQQQQQQRHSAVTSVIAVDNKPPGYCSAFRPVVRSHSGPTLHTVESLIRPSVTTTGTKCVTSSSDVFRAVAATAGHYVNTGGVLYLPRDGTDSPASVKDSSSVSSRSGDSDRVIDVEMMDDCKDDDKLLLSVKVKGSPVPKNCRSEAAAVAGKEDFCCLKEAKERRLTGSGSSTWASNEHALRGALGQAKLPLLDIKDSSGICDTPSSLQLQVRHQGLQNEALGKRANSNITYHDFYFRLK